MKRTWEVHPWHSTMPQQAAALCRYENGAYWFEGSVDEFLEKYEGNVLVLVNGPILGVSHKNHFRPC